MGKADSLVHVSGSPDDSNRFPFAGEFVWRAAQLARLFTLPACVVVNSTWTFQQSLESCDGVVEVHISALFGMPDVRTMTWFFKNFLQKNLKIFEKLLIASVKSIEPYVSFWPED